MGRNSGRDIRRDTVESEIQKRQRGKRDGSGTHILVMRDTDLPPQEI
jgi:hypothetical protein